MARLNRHWLSSRFTLVCRKFSDLVFCRNRVLPQEFKQVFETAYPISLPRVYRYVCGRLDIWCVRLYVVEDCFGFIKHREASVCDALGGRTDSCRDAARRASARTKSSPPSPSVNCFRAIRENTIRAVADSLNGKRPRYEGIEKWIEAIRNHHATRTNITG